VERYFFLLPKLHYTLHFTTEILRIIIMMIGRRERERERGCRVDRYVLFPFTKLKKYRCDDDDGDITMIAPSRCGGGNNNATASQSLQSILPSSSAGAT
jgi:hypothetical protein